jgi:hypothetical protein
VLPLPEKPVPTTLFSKDSKNSLKVLKINKQKLLMLMH